MYEFHGLRLSIPRYLSSSFLFCCLFFGVPAVLPFPVPIAAQAKLSANALLTPPLPRHRRRNRRASVPPTPPLLPHPRRPMTIRLRNPPWSHPHPRQSPRREGSPGARHRGQRERNFVFPGRLASRGRRSHYSRSVSEMSFSDRIWSALGQGDFKGAPFAHLVPEIHS